MFACSRPPAGGRDLRRSACRIGPGRRAAARPLPRVSRVEASSARPWPRAAHARRSREHPGGHPNDRCPRARRAGLARHSPSSSYDRPIDPHRSVHRHPSARRIGLVPHCHRRLHGRRAGLVPHCRRRPHSHGRRGGRARHSHHCRSGAPDARSHWRPATPCDPDPPFRAGPDARSRGPRAGRIARACPALSSRRGLRGGSSTKGPVVGRGTPYRAVNAMTPANVAGVIFERTGGVLLSQGVYPQVPSARAGLTAVFGMGTGVSPPPWPPDHLSVSAVSEHSIASTNVLGFTLYVRSSPRPISTGRLNTSPCVHLRPINLVVYQGPYPVNPVGNLISE